MESQGIVESHDGTGLHYVKDLVDNGRAIILIVHGLAEHLGRYDYLKDRLNSFGYNVYRYDNRGHGKSGGGRGYLDKSDDFIDDTNFMVEFIKRENMNLPIFLIGHSIGGFIVTGFGVKYPDKVRGIVLSAALTYDTYGGLKKVPEDLDPTTALPNNLASLISTDPAVVRAYEEDPQVLKQVTASIYIQVLKGINWFYTDGNIKRFTYPCLILHGGDDKIVSPEDSKQLYNNISSTDKELKIYDSLYHEILNEPVKDKIIDDIGAWIEKRLV